MLERLRVKNFKLLRDVELELQRDAPTVLIGPNASGKSTVIEVLDFLARCAGEGLDLAVAAHGGMSAIRTAGVTAPVEIASSWRFSGPESTYEWSLSWTLSIDVGPGGQALIDSEHLQDGERVLLSTSQKGERFLLNEARPGLPKMSVRDPRKLAFQARVDPDLYKGLGWLQFILSEIRILGAMASAPSWSRATAERASARDSMVISTQPFVGREGIGLATALYNLQMNHGDAWERLQRVFRAEFPFVKRIVFPADPGGSRISFALEDERFPGRKIYASEMSDE